jgi:RNase H-fold protein (predicted Holliday junction resolvase)
MNLEMYYSGDEYVQAITRFALDHHISEIVIALPADEDGSAKEILQDIQKLQGKVECQLVTVKPKEEGEPPSSQRKNKTSN